MSLINIELIPDNPRVRWIQRPGYHKQTNTVSGTCVELDTWVPVVVLDPIGPILARVVLASAWTVSDGLQLPPADRTGRKESGRRS